MTKNRAYSIHSTGLFRWLFLALIAAAIAGCSGEKTKTEPKAASQAASEAATAKGDASAGKEIYYRYCHFCHGQKGQGDGPVGIALTPHPADFVNDAKRMSKTDEELFKSITEGIHREVGGESMSMPRWAEILSEKERRDVLAFVRQLEREGKEAGKK